MTMSIAREILYGLVVKRVIIASPYLIETIKLTLKISAVVIRANVNSKLYPV